MWKTQIMMVQLHAGIPSSLQVDQIRTNPSCSLLPRSQRGLRPRTRTIFIPNSLIYSWWARKRLRSNKLYDGKIKQEFIFHLSLSPSPALIVKNPIMHKQAAFPEAGDWTCAILEARAEKCKLRQRRNQNGLNYFAPPLLTQFFFCWKSVWKSVLWKEGSLPFLPWLFVVQKYFSSINLDLDGWEKEEEGGVKLHFS